MRHHLAISSEKSENSEKHKEKFKFAAFEQTRKNDLLSFGVRKTYNI